MYNYSNIKNISKVFIIIIKIIRKYKMEQNLTEREKNSRKLYLPQINSNSTAANEPSEGNTMVSYYN